MGVAAEESMPLQLLPDQYDARTFIRGYLDKNNKMIGQIHPIPFDGSLDPSSVLVREGVIINGVLVRSPTDVDWVATQENIMQLFTSFSILMTQPILISLPQIASLMLNEVARHFCLICRGLTMGLQSVPNTFIHFTETAMRGYALHRRVDKLIEANFWRIDGERAKLPEWQARCDEFMGVAGSMWSPLSQPGSG